MNEQPIRDMSKTQCQRQADAIADVQAAVGYANAATEHLVRELEVLRRRVDALEAGAIVTVSVRGNVHWDSGTIQWKPEATA